MWSEKTQGEDNASQIQALRSELNSRDIAILVLQRQVSRFYEVINEVRESIELKTGESCEGLGWPRIERGLRVLADTTVQWATEQLTRSSDGATKFELLRGENKARRTHLRGRPFTSDVRTRSIQHMKQRASSSASPLVPTTGYYNAGQIPSSPMEDLNAEDMVVELQGKLKHKDDEIRRLRWKVDCMTHRTKIFDLIASVHAHMRDLREVTFYIRNVLLEFRRYMFKDNPVPVLVQHLQGLLQEHERTLLACEQLRVQRDDSYTALQLEKAQYALLLEECNKLMREKLLMSHRSRCLEYSVHECRQRLDLYEYFHMKYETTFQESVKKERGNYASIHSRALDKLWYSCNQKQEEINALRAKLEVTSSQVVSTSNNQDAIVNDRLLSATHLTTAYQNGVLSIIADNDPELCNVTVGTLISIRPTDTGDTKECADKMYTQTLAQEVLHAEQSVEETTSLQWKESLSTGGAIFSFILNGRITLFEICSIHPQPVEPKISVETQSEPIGTMARIPFYSGQGEDTRKVIFVNGRSHRDGKFCFEAEPENIYDWADMLRRRQILTRTLGRWRSRTRLYHIFHSLSAPRTTVVVGKQSRAAPTKALPTYSPERPSSSNLGRFLNLEITPNIIVMSRLMKPSIRPKTSHPTSAANQKLRVGARTSNDSKPEASKEALHSVEIIRASTVCNQETASAYPEKEHSKSGQVELPSTSSSKIPRSVDVRPFSSLSVPYLPWIQEQWNTRVNKCEEECTSRALYTSRPTQPKTSQSARYRRPLFLNSTQTIASGKTAR